MTRTNVFVVLFFVMLAALPSCRVYHGGYHVGSEKFLLAQHDKDRHRESFYLMGGSGAAGARATLRIVTEDDHERPHLGLALVEIDKKASEVRGVLPYSGLLVTRVYDGSAGAEAGVMKGDVLLSLNGVKTVYLEQFSRTQGALQAGEAVGAVVLRGPTEMDVMLKCQMLRERRDESQDVLLETVRAPERPYAGVELGGIPDVWCERIYGTKRNGVVVTGIEVGSPAWIAGVRGGDVIDTVDGAPAPTAADLARRIEELGPSGAKMHWSVRRGADERHEADVELADYSGQGGFWVPFIASLSNSSYQDHWTVGPFGLLLNNTNTYIADSRSRQVKSRNVFHALLGLFYVETKPDETTVRLLWFISFDT